ncbi:TetR family transcriptional regulator [Allobaculum sp. Allo2]|uniref:TetR family transcriptional regulator n=1 Tax=Allobaculum sp. Allo2 TaxID=2853432 RepID=UPI003462A9C6|nr:TetR/AcrR family transcriptional regulator [Allobaculum sp. Allo2]
MLSAALALLSSRDLAEVSISDITNRAGVAKGTFYSFSGIRKRSGTIWSTGNPSALSVMRRTSSTRKISETLTMRSFS